MFEMEGYEWTKKNISLGISMYNPSIEMYCGKAFKDGNRTFHCWNEEKEKYCDVGKNGKYQCWELDD